MNVHVIYAVNTSAFDDEDIMVAGETKEAAEAAFDAVINCNWLNWLDEETMEFYENDEENYNLSFRQSYWILPVAK